MAIHEGACLGRTLFEGTPTAPDHENVPSAVFSQPPIATVGLTEAQARARRGPVDVYRSRFGALRHTLTGRDEKMLVKAIVERSSDRVPCVHGLGAEAAEIVQGWAVALRCGVTKTQLDATIGVHPTSAEGLVTLRGPVAPPEPD